MKLIAQLEDLAQRHVVASGRGEAIVWRRFGTGTPLVLLHGGHGSWLHWARNLQALAARHTVWVPDLPGYGESSAPVEATLPSLVIALCDTLDRLVGADTTVHVAGFSFGGLVAASVARSRSVSSLALMGPGGHGGPRRPRGELQQWRSAHAQGDQAALTAAMHHNLLMHMLHDVANVDSAALHVHTQSCLNTRFRSKPISRAGHLLDFLSGYLGPLLLVWGEHDVTAEPQQASQVLAQGRTNCRTYILPGAGHWVQYEVADTVNALLLERLREVEKPLDEES